MNDLHFTPVTIGILIVYAIIAIVAVIVAFKKEK